MTRRFWFPRLQFIVFGVVEGLVFLSYQHSDGRFHWFFHFFVGGTVTFSILATCMYWTRRPVRRLLLWLFLGHMLAMFPDILFGLLSIAHEPWKDIFLLHISAHFVPGRNWTWYAIFLVSLGSYLAACYVIKAREISVTPPAQAPGISTNV